MGGKGIRGLVPSMRHWNPPLKASLAIQDAWENEEIKKSCGSGGGCTGRVVVPCSPRGVLSAQCSCPRLPLFLL